MVSKNFTPQQISPASYQKKQTIPIDTSLDPRYTSILSPFTISRQGAEVAAIGMAKSFVNFLNTLESFTGSGGGGNGGGLANPPTSAPDQPGIPLPGYPPLQVTITDARYLPGPSIEIDFIFDTSLSANQYFAYFGIEIATNQISNSPTWLPLSKRVYLATAGLTSLSTSQTLVLDSQFLSYAGLSNLTNFKSIGVATYDIADQTSGYVTYDLSNTYSTGLNAPILSDLIANTASYTATATNYATESAKSNFVGMVVEEFVTDETNLSTIQANDSTNAWVQAAPIANSASVSVLAADGKHRWVRAWYEDVGGGKSAYSNYKDVTPTAINPSNTQAPSDFSSGTTASWDGTSVKITWVMPSTNAPFTVKVKVNPVISGTVDNSHQAYYYHNIATNETTWSIPATDLYAQLGSYYSSLSIVISGLSVQGVETAGKINIGIITRTNSDLAAITPTLGTPNINTPGGHFTVNGIPNGYIVTWDLPTSAAYMEVYESKTAWASDPTNDAGISYQGQSPAVVQTTDNDPRYIVVRYYDVYDNHSNYSPHSGMGYVGGVKVQPNDLGANSLIDYPIKISTNGSIFSGIGGATDYPNVFFNSSGLFAYDSSGNWTTEIINNADTDQPTFITKRATIADWSITNNAIESTLTTGITKYTGLSASNTSYAFWAGASTSKNSTGDAQFSVSPTGAVIAKDIAVQGGTLSVGSNFSVTNTGVLTATSANITGSLNVGSSSTFDANINMTSNGILSAFGIDASNNLSTQTTGSSVQIRGGTALSPGGIFAYDKSHSLTTWIAAVPVGSNNYTFQTKAALLGSAESTGWIVKDSTIQSGNGKIILDANAKTIKILSSDNDNYGIQLDATASVGSSKGGTGSLSGYAIKIGLLSQNGNFNVDHTGSLTANNATLTGGLTVSSKIFGGNSTALTSTSYADFVNKLSNGAAGFWLDSTGSFVMGKGNSYIGYDATKIVLNAGSASSGDRSAYTTSSKIELNSSSNGVSIYALPIQGDADLNYYQNSTTIIPLNNEYYFANSGTGDPLKGDGSTTVQANGHYRNIGSGSSGLGPYARQRMLVEDPVTGQVQVGMAVYYASSGVTPSSGGYVGDLWVIY